MNVITSFANPSDIFAWMELVEEVKDYFPGLDKTEYVQTLKACIEKQEAICAKMNDQLVGILLFSVEHSILAFLAVSPAYRKCGIASKMILRMCEAFPEGKDIWVTTYRGGDPKGEAARALYQHCGFTPDKLVVEMDYPCQMFVKRR